MNLNIVVSAGETPVRTLIDTHRDIADLTFTKLGNIKDHIVERIRRDKLKRYTRGTLKRILKESIKNGKLRLEDLKESVQSNL